ncbi:MAG: hypothetical protein JW891_17625 [Candidatus Lokiarchaeota archaeon]|nr:hypothetical protein [Candidatus Lokiarchaeota archaeon]
METVIADRESLKNLDTILNRDQESNVDSKIRTCQACKKEISQGKDYC